MHRYAHTNMYIHIRTRTDFDSDILFGLVVNISTFSYNFIIFILYVSHTVKCNSSSCPSNIFVDLLCSNAFASMSGITDVVRSSSQMCYSNTYQFVFFLFFCIVAMMCLLLLTKLLFPNFYTII